MMVTGDGVGVAVGEAAGDWGRSGERESELQPARRSSEAAKAAVVSRRVFMGGSLSVGGLAVRVVVVVAVVLVDLAGDGADASACSSADDGSLKAAAKEGSDCGSACSADERSLAGAYASAVVVVVVVVVIVVVAIVVVITAVTASAYALVEVVISVLGGGGKSDGKQQRRDE